MKKETVGYILLALGIAALFGAQFFASAGSAVVDPATGQTWKLILIGFKSHPSETYYVTANNFASFWLVFAAGVALFIWGLTKIPRASRGR